MGKGKKKREAKKTAAKKSGAKHYSELKHHKQAGKLLQPPLLSIPNLKTSSWIDDRLPEMLWTALLITHLPRELALKTFRRVAKLLEGKFEPNKPIDVGHSGLAELHPSLSADVLALVCSVPGAREILRGLLVLEALPLRDEWLRAIAMDPGQEDWDVLRLAVGHVFDHQSQEATDCRWLRILVALVSGQLKLPSEEMVRQLLYYPAEGDQRQVRPFIRASEISFGNSQGAPTRVWPSAFWEQCWRDTGCIPTQLELAESSARRGTTVQQVSDAASALRAHFLATSATTTVDAKHDTIFGMAAYAVAILSELLRVGAATSIIARLALRTLLEIRLTLEYLVTKDSPVLWNEYRAYGVGQAKLAFLKLDDDIVREVGFVNADALSAIANEDRSAEFVPINLGNWEGSNLRKMSDETGLKPEYDLYYPWTSAYAHANWGALRSANFDLCLNALHRAHRILRASAAPLNDVVTDACELIDRILETVDKSFPNFTQRVTVTFSGNF